MRKKWKRWQILFSWAPKSLQMVTATMKLKMLAPWKESYDRSIQHIKSREIPLPTKVHIVKAVVFLVVTYGCKSWTIRKAEHGRIDAFKLWCWRRLLRVPWTARRSNQSNPKGNQVWIFIGMTDDEAPVLWPPNGKSWLIGNDPDAGKDWGQKEKRAAEDGMVR